MNFLTEIQEGMDGGTGSIKVSSGGTIVDRSSGALVGYLLGHRRFNSGVHCGWGRWFSLGPRWSGIPARVSVSGSIGGDQVTEGDHQEVGC